MNIFKASLLSLAFVFSWSFPQAVAKDSKFGETLAQAIASLDWTTAKCAPRVEFEGANFVLMQGLWRGVLVQSDGRFQTQYESELGAIAKDMEAAALEGKDACLIMFLWFRGMYANTSPIKQMN